MPGLGPSGLSDYEVSPLGMSTALLGSVVRVAVLARTSTEDQQDRGSRSCGRWGTAGQRYLAGG